MEFKSDNIIAYRVWHVRESALYAVSRQYRWPYRESATGALVDPKCPLCERGGHDTMGGVHAATSLENEEVLRYLEYSRAVAGQVVLGGKIVEHDNGYRAEQGYPYCLYYVPWQAYPSKTLVRAAELKIANGYATENEIRDLAARYGCEVAEAPLAIQQHAVKHLRALVKRWAGFTRKRPKWNDKTHWGVPGRTMIALCEELEQVGRPVPQQGVIELVQKFGRYDSLGAWLIIKRCLDRGLLFRHGARGSLTIMLNDEWRKTVAAVKEHGRWPD